MANINDLDYTVNSIFGPNGAIKHSNSRIDTLVEESTKCGPVKYTKKSRQKPKGMKNLAIKAIVFVALGAGLVSGIHGLKEAYEDFERVEEVRDIIGSPVSENTEYFGYNSNEQRPYWDYDTYNMARDVLDTNKEYDVDTRIYGCYSSLNEYRKEASMDEIFRNMSKFINDNPDAYTEDEVKACLHDSFGDYLNSKNITLEDYTKLMEKVVKAYTSENKSEEEIKSLLSELNGGSR